MTVSLFTTTFMILQPMSIQCNGSHNWKPVIPRSFSKSVDHYGMIAPVGERNANLVLI